MAQYFRAMFGVVFIVAMLSHSMSGAEERDVKAETSKPRIRHAFKLDFLDDLTEESLRHPLVPALQIAYETMQLIDGEVHDYTCMMVKRERIKGRLRPHEYIRAKIRHEKRIGTDIVVPFSVYLYFDAPGNVKGREVLFVRAGNDSEMIARNGGSSNLKNVTLTLDPRGKLAMRNNRNPITEIGIRNLTRYLIDAGRVALEKDLQRNECDVKITAGAKINRRPCSMIQVTFPVRRDNLDFHIARIFIDDHLKLPVRFAYYSWPREGSDDPVLMEEYTYVDLKVNTSLTDGDFDRNNPEYNFYDPGSDSGAGGSTKTAVR